VRINCVSRGWILTERAQQALDAMTVSERAQAPAAIPLDTIADDALNHQVVVL